VGRDILILENVRVRRGERIVLDGASLAVEQGSRLVIRGDNGSGKTTLLQSALGLLPLESGTIRLDGAPVGTPEWRRRRPLAAWVPQDGLLHRFPLAAWEAVAVGLAGARLRRRDRDARIRRALEDVDAVDLADRCFHRLSGGERQRVSIARCLAQGAEVLLLDEPGTALDAESRKRLVLLAESLSDEGKTFVVVTHDESLFDPARWKEHRLSGGRLC